jgi:N-acetylglucosaminyldiphosphoundecaprenol N-acetyl-beta-D-mannosaminyltransferase
MINKFDVLGIPISATTLKETATLVNEWASDKKGRYICVREVASLMASRDDPDLVQLHHEAALVVPDGMPLVWIGKRRGYDIERTCGPDLFDLICRQSPQSGLKHYFYGGKEGVAEKLTQVCRSRYPGIQIVGHECPPFRPLTPEEDAAVINRITASGADVVWVGISSPKQDVWMRDHVNKLPQTMIGVGAAFDFHTGEVKRAPKWMQKRGLESVYRLFSEPRRLWRRYLILAPKFVWLSLTTGS